MNSHRLISCPPPAGRVYPKGDMYRNLRPCAKTIYLLRDNKMDPLSGL
ncbi:hypothetical protein OOU_Y34scaffold00126g99 [Pyricularia oryzae Y34]|uniref:Uncharacterized protein n=3 Tax=Pyricularia oryzae TaxID=318829 RepID=A0A4V1C763_PYROR|nr:hypothetical protein OOU_Y34scaffold00126g99 [Pyricularia oryzae Y34]QBZ62288.1 hypothetical protein PoMZ_11166 [Pyricularia oryzae]